MSYKFWTNVGVSMASSAGIGAAQAVSAITKASPPVCTYVGADPANGTYVLLRVAGMTQANARIFRVANLNAGGNTIELEGADSTLWDTLVATGSYLYPLSFDTAFSTLSEPNASGGDPIFEDTTLIHDSVDTEAIVSASAQGYGFTSVWDPSNAALIEANKAFIARTPRPMMIVFSDASRFLFSGYVSAPLAPAVSGRKVSTPVSLRLEATGTSYAT
jgi:hypothetical protein